MRVSPSASASACAKFGGSALTPIYSNGAQRRAVILGCLAGLATAIMTVSIDWVATAIATSSMDACLRIVLCGHGTVTASAAHPLSAACSRFNRSR